VEPVVEGSRRGYRLLGRRTYGRLLQGEKVQLLKACGNSRSVVAPYLKALRRPSVQLRALYSSVGVWSFRAA
jgi:hypothetical protein